MADLFTAETRDYLILACVFLGILMLFTGLMQLVRSGENRSEARSRRMKMIDKGASVEDVLAVLLPRQKSGLIDHVPLLADLPRTLQQAGMTIAPNTFLMACCGATLAIFLASCALMPVALAALGAISAGLLAPLVIVRARRSERHKLLEKQLPDALNLMARGLRVGHPLNTSIGAVAQEMPDPIGTEFGLIFDQVSFGDDLTDAVQEFADRVGLEDVQYLSASIGIQYGSGGDLARVISILSQVIRERLNMRKKIRAISSEGRLTAWFLSALPVLIFTFSNLTNPTYFGSVKDDPLFIPMLTTIGTLTLLNFLMLRRIVNFRV